MKALQKREANESLNLARRGGGEKNGWPYKPQPSAYYNPYGGQGY